MDEFQEVRHFLNTIKKKNQELYCAMMLVYLCGIRKNELVSIKIEDIKEQENCYLINIDDKEEDLPIIVENEAYDILQKYLSNLEQDQKFQAESFLFPNYIGENGERKISRHLKKYPNFFTVNQIQSAGIKAFDKDLSKTISNNNQRIKQVAKQFRKKSSQAVRDQLQNTIKPPGKTKDYLMQKKLVAFYDEISMLKSPYIKIEITNLSNKFYNHLNKCQYDKKKTETLKKSWRQSVSNKLKEIGTKEGLSQSKRTVKDNTNFNSKIKRYHLNIEFTAKHHALLFSSITQETFNQIGKKKGEAVICEAVKTYGQQCGARMALQARNNGENLSIFNYLSYRKWEVPKDTMEFKLIEKIPNVHLKISKCPWYKVWKKNDLLKYGKYYCKEINTALAHGFNPELKIEINSIQTNKNNISDFIFKDTCIDSADLDLESNYKSTLLSDTATTIPWEFYVGHLFKTMGEVIKHNLGHIGDKIMTKALINFENILTNFRNKNFFPEDYIEIIQEHVNTNFDLEPKCLQASGTTPISIVRESKILKKTKTLKSTNRASNPKIRVSELAKNLDINKRMVFLEVIKKLGIKVKSHMSSLTKTNVKTIKKNYRSLMMVTEQEIKKNRRQWIKQNTPETKKCDISKFKEELENLHKDMGNLKIQQKTELLVPYILEKYENFKKIEKRTDIKDTPCEFSGSKNATTYIIKFQGFLDRFNMPDNTQKIKFQKILKEIKNVEIVLLQVKINKSQYRIFYTTDMKIFSWI